MKNKNELTNEQLEKISGGLYSSKTYDDLGVKYSSTYQKGSNHPLITTMWNYCWMSGNQYCEDCGMETRIGPTRYCGYRSDENDPAK